MPFKKIMWVFFYAAPEDFEADSLPSLSIDSAHSPDACDEKT